MSRGTAEQQYIQLGVRVSVAHEMMVGWVEEGDVLKVELREKVGEEMDSGEIVGIDIGITSDIDRDIVVFFLD